MKLNKRLFYFAMIVTVITLAIATILQFCIKTELALYISGVLLNIFAGTIVMIVTSLIDYFIQRRKILTAIMDKIVKYRHMFSKIKYLDLEEHIATYEEYVDYYKKVNEEIKVTKKMYNSYKEEKMTQIKDSMQEIMDAYINIADVDFEDTWQLWDELCFLGSNKKKRYLHKEVFGYLYDLINCCRLEKRNFNEFHDYKSNYEDIADIQTKIFYYEEKDSEEKSFDYNGKRIFIDSYGMCSIRNKNWIIVNKVEEHLTNMFDEVGKIAYFDKKYNGLRELEQEEK